MDLEKLFYPKNIAVIGASPNLSGGKLPYFQLLRSSGFKGAVYPVNPRHHEIDGNRVYADINLIDDNIDLAIVTVPVSQALSTMKSVVAKGAKFVHFFTSGFGEMGNIEIETAMLDLLKDSKTRIVGPNCLGVLCAESNLTFSFKLQQEEAGSVAFLGQSGGLTDIFISMCGSRKIGINKTVSYGNQIDLRVEDYLAYFSEDNHIEVIAAYIEDIKNSRRFLEVLKKLALKKPVIILKGGSTPRGAKAASSHTGALALSYDLFSNLLKQTGCIEVESFESLLDIVMLATTPKVPSQLETCFLGGGGGNSVISTDLGEKSGLTFPDLQSSTQDRIQSLISQVNTSTTNPVDMGAFGFDMDVVMQTLKIIDDDDGVNVIIPDFTLGMLPSRPDYPVNKLADVMANLKKPVIPIVSKITENNLDHENDRLSFFHAFRKAGLPVYQNMQNAAISVQKIVKWRNRSKSEHI